MRFRRRAPECPYLLGKGALQTPPTVAVVPHPPTGSDSSMSSAQLQPLWRTPLRQAQILILTRISLRMTRIERL